ncbi:MAG: CpsB/CapC family capsule biosynthesis tyrosine phosphatase [Thermodesulfobacteriota bacterium]|nr:CpsB/CapC family capsule biosynthesis tyrosine phosphatase [Thermodesulfobacteriota bacterium]
MIDIHNHILPAVDDGAVDMAESVAMAEIAARDGIRNIIATPHLMPGMTLDAIRRHVQKLNTALKDAEIPVFIHHGAEIPVHLLEKEAARIGLAASGNLLVEFPPNEIPPFARAMFAHLTGRGHAIIVAHPERNMQVIENPERLQKVLMPSVSLQITAGSLTGAMGRGARACAIYLLKKGLVTFIASDAHNAKTRVPRLAPAVKVAGRYMATATVDAMVREHPRRIVEHA